jgi:hypothetical protein
MPFASTSGAIVNRADTAYRVALVEEVRADDPSSSATTPKMDGCAITLSARARACSTESKLRPVRYGGHSGSPDLAFETGLAKVAAVLVDDGIVTVRVPLFSRVTT